MIGDAPLGEIVGADPFGAVAAADLQAARVRLRALLLLLLGGQQARLEQRHGARAVLVLRTLVLAFHHDAARQVRDAHRGIGLVDVLAARARGAVGVDAQLGRVDLDLVDLIELGQDRHCACRGVNAPLGLGRRHALYAVRSGFELQQRECTPADDAADDLLVAAVLARALAEHLHCESPAFRVARVHAVQVTGEHRRLIAPGTGAHLEEDVPVIARIPRQQEPAQLALRGFELALHAPHLLLPERAYAGVRIGPQVARRGQIAFQAVVAAKALRQRLQARVLHGQLAELLRAAGHLVGGQHSAHLLEAVGQFLQALADGVLHGCGLGRGILRDVCSL